VSPDARPDRHALLELQALLAQIGVLRSEGDADRFTADARYRRVLHRLWIAAGNEALAYTHAAGSRSAPTASGPTSTTCAHGRRSRWIFQSRYQGRQLQLSGGSWRFATTGMFPGQSGPAKPELLPARSLLCWLTQKEVLGGFEGTAILVAQRILAMTAAIWHNNKTGQPITRSLITCDH